MTKVLIVDDEHAICQAFSQIINNAGHSPLIAADGTAALNILQHETPSAIFLDVQLPDMNGLEILEKIHNSHPELPVIMITAHGTMKTAMQAMQRGAFDYLSKPLELEHVRRLLDKVLSRPSAHLTQQQSKQNNTTSKHSAIENNTPKTLIGNSPAMQEIFKLMGLLTTNDLTVLLCGESGVGKELVARAIHDHSERKQQPFMAFNCAAVPENLMESELFGHERGAFTGADNRRIGRFEAAQQGTLFLDEIGEMPYHLQSKLLRVLQERSFERVGSVTPITLNARVMAATNRKLEAEVNAGRFREDLYYRLKLVTLEIPPLRKRGDDITTLAQYFLQLANQELKRHINTIENSALDKLRQYHWPGNVRELENVIKHGVLISHGTTLNQDDISLDDKYDAHNKPDTLTDHYQILRQAACSALHQMKTQQHEISSQGEAGLFHQLVSLTEKALIEEALNMTDGNQVAAAKLLGLHRSTLRKKLGI